MSSSECDLWFYDCNFCDFKKEMQFYCVLFSQAFREKQKSVKENHAPRMKQMKMWKVIKL